MRSQSLLALVALTASAAAHFELVYPPARGDNDENEYTFPCGGYAQTQNRTTISSTSFPLVLDLGHDRSIISVLLAVGNDVGNSFNTFLRPTVQEEGPGDFCVPEIAISSSLNITEGTNGTIQVITDGHGGGLYMCADVTFSATAATPPTACTNGTGLTASFLANATTLSNQTETESSDHGGDSGNSTSSGSPTSSATASGASSSSSSGASAAMTVGWGVLGAALVGGAALL